MHFKRPYINQTVNQIKYGQIKTVNFRIGQLNHSRKKNDKQMYSTHYEVKSVAERFVTILKKKIYKHMTSISKNVNIDKLFDSE